MTATTQAAAQPQQAAQAKRPKRHMLRTLGRSLREYKKVSILTPVAVVIEGILEILIPTVMASLIDEGISGGSMPAIIKFGLILLLCSLCSLAAGFLAGKFAAIAGAGFAKNLRHDEFEKVQGFSFTNIDRFSTGSIITRLTTDVTNLQNAYQMLLRMCVRAPISLICAMIMAFFINARLASVYLIAVIVLGMILAIITVRAHHYFMEVFPKYDDLNASVQENVSAIRVVKAYVREDYEKKKFTTASKNIYNMFVKAESVLAFNSPVMQIAVYSCIIALSWLGAKMIVAGSLTTGELMSLLTYCMNIMMSLMMLSMVFVMLAMSIASAERICEVLNEKSDITNPENPVYEVADGSVTFDHVTFRYNKTSDKPILDDVNLSIRSGETIGVIGGTGSSKSSLVNLISRLYDVSEGAVLVGGKDVRSYDLDTLRDEVSVVLQNNVLFSGTIYENLRWGDKNATDEECRHACRLACADEFIDRFPNGYNTYIEQGGTNVSGGQKQRLCIARALLKKPKILILDDSTSAVDTATDAKIRKAFAEEIPDTTKFIIAQRISSVQNADRIIVLDNGVVNGFGTHEELLASNDIYRDVYESQTSGSGDFDEGGAA